MRQSYIQVSYNMLCDGEVHTIVRSLCDRTVSKLYTCPRDHRQCKQCAMYIQRNAFAAHMDEHYLSGALRSRTKNRRYICRGFFPTLEEWCEGRHPHAYDVEDDTSQEKPTAYKRSRPSMLEYVAHVPLTCVRDDTPVVPMRMDIEDDDDDDDDSNLCVYCLEPLTFVYDHERDMWMFVDATLCPHERVPCHVACLPSSSSS